MKAIVLLYSVSDLRQVDQNHTVYIWTRVYLSERNIYLNLRAVRNNKYTTFFGKKLHCLFIPQFKGVGFPLLISNSNHQKFC